MSELDIDASRVTIGTELRERVAHWSTIALLFIFLIITVGIWGYAASWVAMKLVELVL